MRIHASCVSRDDDALLLLGAPGSGKSSLALALIDRGFVLVADDAVLLDDGRARAPEPLRGLIEVRGLGLLPMPCRPSARAVLALAMDRSVERLPADLEHLHGIPILPFDGRGPTASFRAVLALDCALGRRAPVAGAFAP